MSVPHLLFCLVLVQCSINVSGAFGDFMNALPKKIWGGILDSWDSLRGVTKSYPAQTTRQVMSKYTGAKIFTVDIRFRQPTEKSSVKRLAINIPFLSQPKEKFHNAMRPTPLPIKATTGNLPTNEELQAFDRSVRYYLKHHFQDPSFIDDDSDLVIKFEKSRMIINNTIRLNQPKNKEARLSHIFHKI